MIQTEGSQAGDCAVQSALTIVDDLTGKAGEMEQSWYVKEKVVVLEYKNGETVRRNHAIVKVGDFVNVSVVLQIQKRPPLVKPKVRVNVSMKEITVLESKSKVSIGYWLLAEALTISLDLFGVPEEGRWRVGRVDNSRCVHGVGGENRVIF